MLSPTGNPADTQTTLAEHWMGTGKMMVAHVPPMVCPWEVARGILTGLAPHACKAGLTCPSSSAVPELPGCL